MADFVFNVAKGRAAHLASLPGSDDALIAVPLEATDLEADSVLIDADTLAAVLSGTTNEQTTMGRLTLSGTSVTVDDVNNRVDADADDLVWPAASGAEIAAILICYDPDTTASVDSAIVPLTKHDFVAIPTGGDVVALVDTAGFYRAD